MICSFLNEFQRDKNIFLSYHDFVNGTYVKELTLSCSLEKLTLELETSLSNCETLQEENNIVGMFYWKEGLGTIAKNFSGRYPDIVKKGGRG